MQLTLHIWLVGLSLLAPVVLGAWVVGLVKRDVGIVDVLWGMMFLLLAAWYYHSTDLPTVRGRLVLTLTAIWSIRLSAHIGVRNAGKGEDHRYQSIRSNNEPHFWLKSLYIVFGLQAVLAWLISLPLIAGITSTSTFGFLDVAGVAVWLFGFVFETIADIQLYGFRADPSNDGAVLDRGLWRFTRHPNYFGEWCVWIGFALIGVGAGGWYSLVGLGVISVLLMRVSGVGLLERSIEERRPAYKAYIASTNAFFPGRSRRSDRRIT